MKTPFLLILSVSIASCSPHGSADTEGPQPSGNDERFRPTVLPTSVAAGDCDSPPRPTVCEWANSMDAVVVGNIESVDPILEPVWVERGANPPYLSSDGSCDGGWVNIGLVITLSVTDVLYGDVVEPRVQVHVGKENVDQWGNVPYVEGGSVKWITDDPAHVPFPVGTTAGFALTRVPEAPDTWSLMDAAAFTFGADGSAIVAEDLCVAWPVPVLTDFFDLQSELSKCPKGQSARYSDKVAVYRDSPLRTHASLCVIPDGP